VDGLTLLRDGLFCLFTFVLIYYIVQCCIYEQKIKDLKEQNEKLWRMVQLAIECLGEEREDEKEELPSDPQRAAPRTKSLPHFRKGRIGGLRVGREERSKPRN
jgi:hypothetical protein